MQNDPMVSEGTGLLQRPTATIINIKSDSYQVHRAGGQPDSSGHTRVGYCGVHLKWPHPGGLPVPHAHQPHSMSHSTHAASGGCPKTSEVCLSSEACVSGGHQLCRPALPRFPQSKSLSAHGRALTTPS